jgi:hypothetical protein
VNYFNLPVTRNLSVNKNYQVTAIPAPGTIFVDWQDGHSNILGTNVTLVFRMTNDLILNARMVLNPITLNGLAGTYNGLFYETNVSGIPVIKEKSAGALSDIVVTTNRVYSGQIALAGATHGLTGIFNVMTGDDVQTITRPGKTNIVVSLHLDYHGTHRITGTISCPGEGWTALAYADQSGSSFGAHQYTIAIPPAADAPTNSPGGYGYATINVDGNGTATIAGKAADSTPLTRTVKVSLAKTIPLYQDIYAHQGLLLGSINLSSGTPIGDLTWLKPAGTNTGLTTYTNGFTNTITVMGSSFTAANFASNAVEDFTNGFGLSLPLTVHVTVSNGVVATASGAGFATNSVNGTIGTNGVVSLTFRPTGLGATNDRTCAGVVLQNRNAAFGAFIARTNSAGVTNIGAFVIH